MREKNEDKERRKKKLTEADEDKTIEKEDYVNIYIINKILISI